jgi:RNA polymerase sigma factor (sigma-70 family)
VTITDHEEHAPAHDRPRTTTRRGGAAADYRYRILGSAQDAEDLLQETLLAAWRGLELLDGRSSLRAWLYRIATNRCLNALRDKGRLPR